MFQLSPVSPIHSNVFNDIINEYTLYAHDELYFAHNEIDFPRNEIHFAHDGIHFPHNRYVQNAFRYVEVPHNETHFAHNNLFYPLCNFCFLSLCRFVLAIWMIESICYNTFIFFEGRVILQQCVTTNVMHIEK